MKISVIGGGSYAWMPGLLPQFVSNDFFNGCSVSLMDVNSEALSHVSEFTKKLTAHKPKANVSFTTTTDIKPSLDGADYVVFSISQGGLAAEVHDHVMARKHGHYNIKGSEVGIAGASRAIRHVREIVRIARLMEVHCPNAMILNVSNPLTVITRSVEKYTKIKSVGFCPGIVGHLQVLFPLFGGSWDTVDFNVGGVDHFSFLLDVRVKGKDALQIMKDNGVIERALAGEASATFDDPFAGSEGHRLRFLIWDKIGYLPGLGDEHCAEFFGQLLDTEERRKYYNMTYDRIHERTNTVNRDKQRMLDRLTGKLPIDLEGHSGTESIARFIQALRGGGVFTDVLNYRNEGQIPNLPLDTVVETRCVVDATGVRPIMVGNLPPIVESLIRPIVMREQLHMEAAMEENVTKLKWALATDPLVNEFRGIDELSREVMEYNLQF